MMGSSSSAGEAPRRLSDVLEEDRGYSLSDLYRVLRARLGLLIAVPLLAGVLGYGVAWMMPPTFTATTTFLPPQQQQSSASAALASLGALAGLAGQAVKSPADQYISLMQSVTVADRLIDQFELLALYEAKFREDARRALALHTKIELGRRDGLITVSVDDRKPERAAEMANAYVDELRRLTSTLALGEAQPRRVFFEKQLSESKDKLAAAQRALQASGFTEGALRTQPVAAAESYAKLKAELVAAEVRAQAMRGYLNESSPEFRQAQATVTALRAQLARLEQLSANAGAPDYIGKYREYKYHETLFELLAKQYELARADEAREGVLIQVIDPALPPERRSKPIRTHIALAAAAIAGLLLVVVLVVRDRNRASRSAA